MEGVICSIRTRVESMITGCGKTAICNPRIDSRVLHLARIDAMKRVKIEDIRNG